MEHLKIMDVAADLIPRWRSRIERSIRRRGFAISTPALDEFDAWVNDPTIHNAQRVLIGIDTSLELDHFTPDGRGSVLDVRREIEAEIRRCKAAA